MLKIVFILLMLSFSSIASTCNYYEKKIGEVGRYSLIYLDTPIKILGNSFVFNEYPELGEILAPKQSKYEIVVGPSFNTYAFYSSSFEIVYMKKESLNNSELVISNLQVPEIQQLVESLIYFKKGGFDECSDEFKARYQVLSSAIPHQSKSAIDVFYIEKDKTLLVVRDGNLNYVDVLIQGKDDSYILWGAINYRGQNKVK